MGKRLGLLLAVVVALAVVPAPVAADETRTGGTVVVGADETVDDDLTAFAGTVVVRGTVEGDLTAFAGNVFVDGTVNGDVDAFAGNVRINGTVTGDVNAVGGNVFLAEGASIGGQFQAASGNVVLDGEVEQDARLGAGTITVGPSAVVGGDLVYNGEIDLADGATVQGQVREDDELGVGVEGPVVPGWVGWVYGLMVNLLLGAAVLLVFPAFSAALADRAADSPLRSGGVGLLVLVGVPILIALLFVSLVGIPLGLLGVLVYAVLLWLGYVYGAFAVGTWALGFADAESRWLALLVGVVGIAVVGRIPILGGLVEFVVLLLGLGAFALGVRERYRGRRAARTGTGAAGSETIS